MKPLKDRMDDMKAEAIGQIVSSILLVTLVVLAIIWFVMQIFW